MAASTDVPASSMLAAVEFNDAFVHGPDGNRLDISRFSQGNVTTAGVFRADLYVNEAWMGRAEVNLRAIGGDAHNVQPCFDQAMLERMGVDLGKLSPETTARLATSSDAACEQLPALIPAATAVFDNGEQRLDVSIPQLYMARSARGYVDPKYWDEGMPAARLQYTANAYHSDSAGVSYTQGFVGLDVGLNLGPWRFHHNGNLSSSSGGGLSSTTQYQSILTYAQRSIAEIKSQLMLGDAFTDGRMFDSFGFRGAQLATDDRMFPDSQRGYAPIIHGIANSNARVQIRQNGNIIYETTVSPGAFEINDLYPTGYGGDIDVVVTEADGSQHISRVPFAPMVNALRQGMTRYGLTVGQFRNAGIQSKPALLQATFQHGFSNMFTGYGGVLVSDGYWSALAGLAMSTEFGAIGLDVTHASTHLTEEPNRDGQSIRISYSKLVAPTNTNLTLAAYRYSTRGYLGFSDAVTLRDLDARGLGFATVGTVRGRLQVMLSQILPTGYGSLYLSGSTQDYWNRDGRDTQFQAGYSNIYKSISYGVSAARQLSLNTGRWDNRVMLTLSLPLGKSAFAPYSTTNLQKDSLGATTLQETISGTARDDHALSYSVTAGHTSGNSSSNTNAGVNASYISTMATFTGNVSKGTNYTQYGAGISGGIVAYPGGVTLAPALGETLAVIEAKDAAGARVLNGNGLRIDPWGHAVVSNLTPFSRNEINLDPKGLPLSVELKSTMQNIAPTAGAVVKVKFETDNPGRAVVLHVRTPDGKSLPFGADVLNNAGQSVGTVAQGGLAIVRGVKDDSGVFVAKWGANASDSCQLPYALPKPDANETGGLVRADAECRPN
ncbi:fimbria/pilus outer membrane usher protein [Cupriavidus metallidurans]|uniref:fimbria/pilus outer membrane usher protein n=1 Tax=Cupriavidus metallidurans TaxID=119219 RepID=UPI001F3118B1|nr:fimbria/pilus outer membrane usher protein [Cupriavidus metallidurans]